MLVFFQSPNCEHAKKEMKLNKDKKLDHFLQHLKSFAAPVVCHNPQGGGHCKCTYLHVLWDVNIWTTDASGVFIKTRFSWIGTITQDLQIQQRTKTWRHSWFPIVLMRWTMKPFSHSRRLSALLQSWQSMVLEMEMVIDPWLVNECCNCQATWQYKQQLCQDTRR